MDGDLPEKGELVYRLPGEYLRQPNSHKGVFHLSRQNHRASIEKLLESFLNNLLARKQSGEDPYCTYESGETETDQLHGQSVYVR